MESVGDEFRTQPLFKKININVNIVCKNQTVSAAAKLLRRVFRNLIRNACGALHSALCPTINIEVNPSSFISPHVEIFVADNGPGVAGEILDKLFRPFESFGKKHGTGLRLAMSRHFVEMQDGNLELVKSEDGAIFRVRLLQ